MKKNVIISLADSNYYELLDELVNSIIRFKESENTEPDSQVTPNQKHSVPADPNQPVLSVQLAPSVELYNAINASRSICET